MQPNTITFRVTVQRGRAARQIFANSVWVQRVADEVAASAPLISGQGEDKVVYTFVQLESKIGDDDVEKVRRQFGLVRDLEAQAQANADHPEFADTHRNGDSWQRTNGNWCYVYFAKNSHEERFVNVYECRNGGWAKGYWIGGVATA